MIIEQIEAALAKAEHEKSEVFDIMYEHFDALLAVAKAAIAWKDNTRHGRDHADEGYSIPREEDESALLAALAALDAKGAK